MTNKPDTWQPLGDVMARIVADLEAKRAKPQDTAAPAEPKGKTA